MVMVMPQVTLVLAAACALLNIWLSFRVGQVRRSEKVAVGDGGNERVIRRMRAHLNFAENAPFVIALVLAIELTAGGGVWLWAAAALFVVGRIAHALGMDGRGPGRGIGTALTLLMQLVLAIWALALVVTADREGHGPDIETSVQQG